MEPIQRILEIDSSDNLFLAKSDLILRNFENARSELAELAGIPKIFCANFRRIGNS